MAKTDDPQFDTQQQVAALQQTIAELKATIDSLSKQSWAVQLFINEMFGTDLDRHYGVMGWYETKLEQQRIKKVVDRASWELKQYGYDVVKKEDTTV